ncbi:TBC1 domain family member 1 isoform X2 [Octopus sinensis]|uniref:TBC1 domain family member 4 n=1 Tax=Octopus sinensis TaxID=2607531 RepID=A0A6P7SJQ2_9MOLL|nr:TBC1 domain family member 1 isoform X2 [Octopus sinensis]
MSLAGKKTCYVGQQDGERYSLEEADDEEESSPLMTSPDASSDQSGAAHSPNTAANQHQHQQHHRHHNNINNNNNNDNNNSSYSNSNNVSSTHHTHTGAKASASTPTSTIASEMSTSNSVASSHATNQYHRTVFEVLYLGSATIDKRYSSPHLVMPWVVAEVKRKTDGFREIRLEVREISLRGVQVLSTSSADSSEHAKHIRATSPNTNTTSSAIQSTAALPSLSSQECQGDSNTLQTDTKEFIVFEHKLQGVSRFAESHQEPRCFAYLTRPQLNSDFHCHVFMAPEENQIPELFASIRKATKEHRDDVTDSNLFFHDVSDSAEPAKAFCEVLYLGKVQVDSCKLTSSDIDRLMHRLCPVDEDGTVNVDSRQRHASDASVRSLPASLDNTVTVTENELEQQQQQLHGVKLNGSSSDFRAAIDSPCSSFENIEESSNEMKSNSHQSYAYSSFVEKEGNQEDSLPQNLVTDIVNRTMLFRLGKEEISLINLDQKRVMLERKFSDISFVSQGCKNQEIFGFTAREPGNGLMCHLLKCHSDSVVEEILMSVKSAFKSAYEQNKLQLNQICTMCPLHQLQKLCQEINVLSTVCGIELLKRRVQQLPEKDAAEMHNRWKQENPQTSEELLEVMMMSLRYLCEQKQKEHNHISTGKTAGKLEFNIMDRRTKTSKLDSFRNKAKKSLTNSFESLIRGRKKDEAREAFRQRSGTTDSESSWAAYSVDSSAPTTPELSPSASPMSKERKFQLPTPPDSPKAGIRPRSSTVGAIPMSTARVTKQNFPPANLNKDNNYTLYKEDNSRRQAENATSPMKHMFLISGSSMAQLSPESASSSVCSSFDDQSSVMATPTRRGSWRHAIFNRVVTPADSTRPYSLDDSPSQEAISCRPTMDARARWRKAIQETLLLIRMNKENQNLRARQDEIQQKRQNLDYEEITPCLKEVTKVWDSMLNNSNRKETQFDKKILIDCIKQGVPKSRRGAIWQLLVEQAQLQSPMVSTGSGLDDASYDDLMRRLTTHQHAILIDLGRTFPKHPYFRTQLGPGQLALFNLLKAYSLIDQEVGYCQGLSFIAGMLLIHMDEESAFHILKYLMFNMGLRNQFRPSMTALQIKLYQLTRLIHDNHRDLYEHFEEHEIVPTLYAAPWFLTIFASQFPLGFVSRVFDLIFLQGIDSIFKVALILLGDHKQLIMHCESFESIVEFLKTTLPSMGLVQMERIINQAFEVDYSKQLHAYVVEYQVLQEEMVYTSTKERHSGNSIIHRLEGANRSLKEQNRELMDKLQNALSQQRSLESAINNFQTNETRLRSKLQALELERAALLDRVATLEKESANFQAQHSLLSDTQSASSLTSSAVESTNLPVSDAEKT